ncbi:sugar ABC transporter substrate-binding protein [Ruminococcus gauvreauii]|uniref:sugar ABC transporter substrate-binding protein n=1 Tax=Ruminococcus gauvreauii TaxID=438033 RepID=UPI0039845C2C
MKRRVLEILMMSCIALSLIGCGKSDGDTLQDSKTKEIAFVCPISAGDPNWNNAIAGMEKACEEIGYSVNMVGPAQLDLEQWVKDMDTAISSGYDMIITTGASDVIESGVNRAVDSNIPVCLIDTDLPDSKRFSYIGLDNYQLGCGMADQVAELTGEKGTICLMGMDMTATVFVQRIQGFEDTLKEKYPDMKVATVQSAADAAAAADITGQVINGFPEVDSFVGMDGTVPKGIAQTLTERGVTDEYTATALSIDQQILDYIKDEGLDGGLGLDFYTMGYQAVYNCKAYSDDKNYEEITIPETLPVTKDNTAEFAESAGLKS